MSEQEAKYGPKPMALGSRTVYQCRRCDREFTECWELLEHLYLQHNVSVMVRRTVTKNEEF